MRLTVGRFIGGSSPSCYSPSAELNSSSSFTGSPLDRGRFGMGDPRLLSNSSVPDSVTSSMPSASSTESRRLTVLYLAFGSSGSEPVRIRLPFLSLFFVPFPLSYLSRVRIFPFRSSTSLIFSVRFLFRSLSVVVDTWRNLVCASFRAALTSSLLCLAFSSCADLRSSYLILSVKYSSSCLIFCVRILA